MRSKRSELKTLVSVGFPLLGSLISFLPTASAEEIEKEAKLKTSFFINSEYKTKDVSITGAVNKDPFIASTIGFTIPTKAKYNFTFDTYIKHDPIRKKHGAEPTEINLETEVSNLPVPGTNEIVKASLYGCLTIPDKGPKSQTLAGNISIKDSLPVDLGLKMWQMFTEEDKGSLFRARLSKTFEIVKDYLWFSANADAFYNAGFYSTSGLSHAVLEASLGIKPFKQLPLTFNLNGGYQFPTTNFKGDIEEEKWAGLKAEITF